MRRAVLVLTVALSAVPALARPMPRSVLAANRERQIRVANIARAWMLSFLHASRAQFDGLRWKDDSGKACAYICAALYSLRHEREPVFRGLVSQCRGRRTLLPRVRLFLRTIRSYAIGTKHDYDFVLTDLATLLYVFVNEPRLLDNDMVWSIVCQNGEGGGGTDSTPQRNPRRRATATWSGQGLTKRVTHSPGITAAETENHVLMIHAWRYLVNRYVWWVGNYLHTRNRGHARYDARIYELYRRQPTRYHNEGGALERYLLMALGRVLHNGMFEENSRPYETFSMHAMMNLYLGANALQPTAGGQRVRAAAQNAIEFLLARYAFQSFEGKRVAPFRRQYKYRSRCGVGNNDYLMDIVGMLSGAYVFNDHATDNRVVNFGGGESSYWSRYYYGNIHNTGSGRKALWAALFMDATNYTIPTCIHDFMINKHWGYWARMQTLYTREGYGHGGHYPMINHNPEYFTLSGRRYVRYYRGRINTSPEFYFCTPEFLNSAGGHYTQYFGRIHLPELKEASNGYNFISVPYTVIPRGDVGRFWGKSGNDVARMRNEVLAMRGNHSHRHESRNLWTYKNFTYGYVTADGDRDRHTHWPQEYPPSWDRLPKTEFSIGRASFRILDVRTRRGFYVILAQVSKRYTGSPNLKRYGRGFWEIVPARHFPALATLAARVRNFNPASHFPDYWKSGRYMRGEKHYWYQLAVSGDVVRLHQDAGCSGVQGIMEILDHARRRQHLSEVHTDYTSLGVRMRMPLLHVQAVDNYFHLTNARLAWAAGDGRADISNPFVGQRLLLDSSNILSPRRHVSTILRYLPRAYRRPGSE